MQTRLGIEQIKKRWERVIAKVERGKEVIVCRWGKPVAKLAPTSGKSTPHRRKKRRH